MSERDIFITALQKKDAAERRAYLEEACRTDVALRKHIEGLLQVYEKAGSFLEPSPQTPAATIDSLVREGPGTVIGPYKLLQQIGEGGMAHWQLDEKEQARKWYGQAVQWMDKNKPQDEELLRFRAEAAELLEVKEKKE